MPISSSNNNSSSSSNNNSSSSSSSSSSSNLGNYQQVPLYEDEEEMSVDDVIAEWEKVTDGSYLSMHLMRNTLRTLGTITNGRLDLKALPAYNNIIGYQAACRALTIAMSYTQTPSQNITTSIPRSNMPTARASIQPPASVSEADSMSNLIVHESSLDILRLTSDNCIARLKAIDEDIEQQNIIILDTMANGSRGSSNDIKDAKLLRVDLVVRRTMIEGLLNVTWGLMAQQQQEQNQTQQQSILSTDRQRQANNNNILSPVLLSLTLRLSLAAQIYETDEFQSIVDSTVTGAVNAQNKADTKRQIYAALQNAIQNLHSVINENVENATLSAVGLGAVSALTGLNIPVASESAHTLLQFTQLGSQQGPIQNPNLVMTLLGYGTAVGGQLCNMVTGLSRYIASLARLAPRTMTLLGVSGLIWRYGLTERDRQYLRDLAARGASAVGTGAMAVGTAASDLAIGTIDIGTQFNQYLIQRGFNELSSDMIDDLVSIASSDASSGASSRDSMFGSLSGESSGSVALSVAQSVRSLLSNNSHASQLSRSLQDARDTNEVLNIILASERSLSRAGALDAAITAEVKAHVNTPEAVDSAIPSVVSFDNSSSSQFSDMTNSPSQSQSQSQSQQNLDERQPLLEDEMKEEEDIDGGRRLQTKKRQYRLKRRQTHKKKHIRRRTMKKRRPLKRRPVSRQQAKRKSLKKQRRLRR